MTYGRSLRPHLPLPGEPRSPWAYTRKAAGFLHKRICGIRLVISLVGPFGNGLGEVTGPLANLAGFIDLQIPLPGD